MRKDYSKREWMLHYSFDFQFVNGSEVLSLRITESGIRSRNWHAMPKVLPPEVLSYVAVLCIKRISYYPLYAD